MSVLTYQWQRCQADGSNPADISGETSAVYVPTLADVGFPLRLTGTKDGVAAIPAQTAPIGQSATFAGATAYTGTRPAFTPLRTVSVANQADLVAAIAGLLPGDLVRPSTSFSVSGELTIAKNLSGVAVLELDYGGHVVSFDYGGALNLPSVWIHDSSNIRIYGGVITNPTGGDGILVQGTTSSVLWWDFAISNCGAHGLAMLPATGPIDGCDFFGTVANCGLVLAWDPHAEAGTGLHSCILADAGNDFTNNRVAIDASAQTTGSAMEIGDSSSGVTIANNTLIVRATGLSKVATVQVAGNGLQLWGNAVFSGNVVGYLEVSNAEGRVVDSEGVGTSDLAGVTVVYGRGTNTNQNPNLGTTEPAIPAGLTFDSRYNIILVDVNQTNGGGGGGGGGPAPGTVRWDASLSNGTFGAWAALEDTQTMGTASVGSHTTITLVTSPAPPGGAGTAYGAKCETFGDSTGQTHLKARAEMRASVANTAAIEGQQSEYEWWSYFPSADNGNLTLGWKVITQFASGQQFNGPAIGIYPVGGVPHLFLDTFVGNSVSPHRDLHVDLGPIVLDHWFHFYLTILWSITKSVGKVALDLDGSTVVPLQSAQTKPNDGVSQFMKQGFYRSQSNGGANNTVIHAGTVRRTIP